MANIIYKLNGKDIKIPLEQLEKYMRILNISAEEATSLYLEDNGYLTNDTVEKLTEKAKTAKISHGIEQKRRKSSSKVRKVDEEKEKIIEILEKALKNEGIAAKITNKSKIIEFSIENNQYKLDLIKKRGKKA